MMLLCISNAIYTVERDSYACIHSMLITSSVTITSCKGVGMALN